MNTTTMERTMDNMRTAPNSLEIAGRNLDSSLKSDSTAPGLIDLMGVNAQVAQTASGLTDNDYPSLSGLAMGLANLTQMKTLNKLPLPPEVMEHFGHMQCHCMMGLFTEINRAWLTIDSDIYVWTYEHGSDVAYFDGLNEIITSVGLVKPKPGVFHVFIKYLLVLTTTVDIVVLGVTFSNTSDTPLGGKEEMHLVPDPVFVIPTDGICITTVKGTDDGRLFLGGRDGSLFEIQYQAESSWFGKRFKKINHSTGTLSFLVPSFVSAFSEEDPITQISIDNSRHILYTLSEKGSIEVYDLGERGNSLYRVTKMTQGSLVQHAMNIVKTLDSVNFRPLISISAVEVKESPHINLVAVTQTGVRLYFTTVNLTNFMLAQRPYTLQLLHVRLPPGFSANISTLRPKNVHMANYSERSLVLVSTPNTEYDQLWCLSSDPFPFSSSLMEAYTIIQLDGPVWAMAEVKSADNSSKNSVTVPPLAVRQHTEAPRKYVVLTAQGAHIFIKLRPVDMLRQLLLDSHGPDNEAIKAYFHVQKEEQACATSLILACLDSAQNAEIAEWATRAFFTYGGEPKVLQNPRNQTMFNPALMSTPSHSFNMPHFNQTVSSQSFVTPENISMDAGAQFNFSPKHNGLYLYLSRILRPIWNMNCVQKFVTETKKEFLTSSIESDECIWILDHLVALKTFLNRNTQVCLMGNYTNQSFGARLQPDDLNSTSQSTVRFIPSLQEVQVEERQSLEAIKLFVTHACEILGLWKILCEHQFHLLIDALTKEHQGMLGNKTFKDLFLFGQDMCSVLIISLINSYLGDNASIDSISSKLRDVCPTIYKNEDAACSKANEILLTAKTQQNREEKELMLQSALQLCKDIAPKINLQAACQKFISSQYYNAVIDLCVTCAKKVDPENVAEHYYKSNNSSSVKDHDGYRIYAKRMEIYKEVVNMLEQLYAQNHTVYKTDIPSTPGPPPRPQEGPLMSSADAGNVTCTLISEILDNKDELLHVALYDWMLNKKMCSELLDIKDNSLENYLIKATQQNPNAIEVHDLLWKYYEANMNHAAAAKLLNSLASRPGPSITLSQRLEYLARAVMCMRSDMIGYAPHLGIFLRELEDKIEIAKVQELILQSIMNMRNSDTEESVKNLNSNLYDITTLYERFADPLHLWECKLAIIHCSGHNDVHLMKKIWDNILRIEYQMASGVPQDKLGQVVLKIKSLVHKYRESENCFPLEFILNKLEELNAQLKIGHVYIPSAFMSMGIPVSQLTNIYHRMILVQDRTWLNRAGDYHLYKSLAEIISHFIRNVNDYSQSERRKYIAQSQDILSGILSTLYSKPDTQEMVNVLKSLQLHLNRL